MYLDHGEVMYSPFPVRCPRGGGPLQAPEVAVGEAVEESKFANQQHWGERYIRRVATANVDETGWPLLHFCRQRISSIRLQFRGCESGRLEGEVVKKSDNVRTEYCS